METKSSSETMMWSARTMPTASKAVLSRSVAAMSAWEGSGNAAGVIMGQHHRGGIYRQSKLHNLPDGHPRRIDAAPAQNSAGQGLALGVQTQGTHRLIPESKKPGG